jgi:hypothetical protein
MNKISKYIDICILILIAYLIAVAIIQHFTLKYILSLNFYLGVIAWLFTVCYKITAKDAKYAVFILLLFACFNIVLFSASISSFGKVRYLYNENDFIIASLGLNPFILLIFIIYFFVNKNVGLALYERFFYGSDKEQIEKVNKGINFYYEKFNGYTEEELIKIFKMYKDYPPEAQQALKKIHQERNLSIINS